MTDPASPLGNAQRANLLRPLVTVFAPFAAGYFLSYLYRTVTAVIAPQLIADIGLSPSDLGLLTAAYFFTFAVFQIPLGLLLDSFGPRRVQAALLTCAALGALVFAWGETKEALLLGRGLIGFGVAGGLMGAIKAITLWFPRERWPLVKGCFLAMGGLGAIAATQPVEAALQLTDWRGLFMGLSLATLAAAVLIFLVVPESGTGTAKIGRGEALSGLKRIYGDRFFWRVAPVGIFCGAASMAILGLWAGPWLKDIAGFDRGQVAAHLLAAAAAMAVGSVAAGVAADLAGRAGLELRHVLAVGTAVFLLAQTAIVFEVAPQAYWPWILFGLSAGFTVLVMPQISGHFPLEFAGRANTALNVLLFAMAFTTQYAIGGIIELWPPGAGGGYAPAGYRASFGLFLGLQTLAFLWLIRPERRAVRSA